MNNLTDRDIRLGMLVCTPDGEGIIENADRRKETVGVAVNKDIRNLKTYKISEITLPLGTLPPGITQEIGDIAIIFSRIEDRLQDFLNFVFDFKNTKQRILLIKKLGASASLDMINDIIKDCYSKTPNNLISWKSIYNELKDLTIKRNNIIHGSLFSFNENYIFSNSKKINNIKIDPSTQVFDYESLSALGTRLYKFYYQNMLFLNDICNEVKAHLNLSNYEYE